MVEVVKFVPTLESPPVISSAPKEWAKLQLDTIFPASVPVDIDSIQKVIYLC